MAAKLKTAGQIADIIERFLSGSEQNPQEFNDLVESTPCSPEMEPYRQQCEVLFTEFEPRHAILTGLYLSEREQQSARETAASRALEQIAAELRSLAGE